MKAEYINLFISAVSEVFEEIAQTKLRVGGTELRQEAFYEKNVLVLIGITGKIKGSVVVSMEEIDAKCIASRMMCGMPVETLDEMAQSAVREMVNMVMGRVATLFEGKGKVIDITPPTLITGTKLSVARETSPAIVIKLDELEKKAMIDLDIALKEA